MDTKGTQNGHKMDTFTSKRTKNRHINQKMDTKWTQNGHKMDTKWTHLLVN